MRGGMQHLWLAPSDTRIRQANIARYFLRLCTPDLPVAKLADKPTVLDMRCAYGTVGKHMASGYVDKGLLVKS